MHLPGKKKKEAEKKKGENAPVASYNSHIPCGISELGVYFSLLRVVVSAFALANLVVSRGL
ncbi:uncharacterized protein BO72DRAFT_449331 [Aspergillus fijiensis CBS 313.89]|uniref:Uncharacterized protein n=1 Tax=Aspergillus fijiensis CBS 313.89 TaxID=1448319 RepID=A0A8G1RNE1_9EURO|nr:uncharacterized protein BO72DRAFT_449331 [Aspergillus fijiensis CBS 313.89]RAK75838.1 hypothetical protein BO72DRAFT_449331 [Aspergillus fijiensis CBS 313.89]